MAETIYEPGKVEISSTEYRDLVTEAVEARRDASESRSEKWRVESERDKLKKELDVANKRIAELERVLSALQASIPNSNTNPWRKQDNEISRYETNKTEEI